MNRSVFSQTGMVGGGGGGGRDTLGISINKPKMSGIITEHIS